MRGTGDQIATAKRIIEDILSEDQLLQKDILNTSEIRPHRIKYKQPLFLTSDDDGGHSESRMSLKETMEELTSTSSDNAMDVYVSSICDPGLFYVQKSRSSKRQTR